MIEFSCGTCGLTKSVADEFAGRRVKCPKCSQVPVRLLGFGVHDLDHCDESQGQLFDDVVDRERHRRLDSVADRIIAKLGKRGIRRGASLEMPED